MMSGNFGLMGSIIWILWIAVILSAIFLIKWFLHDHPFREISEPSALEILKQRYAQGEVGMDEYEQRRNDLLFFNHKES